MTEPVDWDYASYLSQVPEGLREQIEPAFKDYSTKLKGSVDEQYGQLAPLKEYLDQGYQPEHFGVGLELLHTLDTNPAKVLQGLINEYPDIAAQVIPQLQQQQAPVQQQQNPGQNSDDPYEERFSQIDQVLQLLTQGVTQQQQTYQQQQQAAQEQQELAQFKSTLDQVAPEDKYPRQFILSYIAQGQSPAEAVKSFTDWSTSQRMALNSQGAPLIAPAGGGGLPSESVDTSKLTDGQRRDMMVQYLERARQQG